MSIGLRIIRAVRAFYFVLSLILRLYFLKNTSVLSERLFVRDLRAFVGKIN